MSRLYVCIVALSCLTLLCWCCLSGGPLYNALLHYKHQGADFKRRLKTLTKQTARSTAVEKEVSELKERMAHCKANKHSLNESGLLYHQEGKQITTLGTFEQYYALKELAVESCILTKAQDGILIHGTLILGEV